MKSADPVLISHTTLIESIFETIREKAGTIYRSVLIMGYIRFNNPIKIPEFK